jgi:GAF domain-containing protein
LVISSVRAAPSCQDGHAVHRRQEIQVEPDTHERSPARRLSTAERLELVQRVAELVARARDVAEVAAITRSSVKEALGASAVVFAVVSADGRSLETVLADGLSAPAQSLLARPLVVDDTMPARPVLDEGNALFWSSLEQRDRDFPAFAGYPSEHGSWAILPLVARERRLGVLSFGWHEHRRFHKADAAVLRAVAHQCGLALDRCRFEQARRVERETLELLSEGTRLMVSALEPERVVASLVRLAVPRLAPWCAVYVAEGNELKRVAIEIERHAQLAGQLRGTTAVSTDSATPLARAYRSGEIQVVPIVSEQMVHEVYEGEQAEAIRAEPAAWTALVVPVRSSGAVIGVMSLVASSWGGKPPPEVLFAAEGLAGRAGVALANAQRFQHERDTAVLLTKALLPVATPDIPGYRVAARYLPAGSAVAGDWFDVCRLPSGGFLVGVGDAGGHGLAAASLMAQLRNGARSLAFAGHTPAEILHCLTWLTAEDGLDRFATACYAVLDPQPGSLVWSSAGHLPVLLLHAGRADYLEQVTHPPLGWPAPRQPSEQKLCLHPGDALVLVTDGVVERREIGLDKGMAMLRELASEAPALPPAELARHIVAALCGQPEDDCCVVVLGRDRL